MTKFALKSLSSIVGKQEIDLLIENDVCYFEEFEDEIKERHQKYNNELGSLLQILERLSNGESLPNEKFKDITPEKELVKEYEVKTKHLRIYLIKKTDGKIIVLGGYKNRQKKDIRKFRSIKSRYLDYKTRKE
jgi:putative component of toxin-antitoxin plasmid stabilization module